MSVTFSMKTPNPGYNYERNAETPLTNKDELHFKHSRFDLECFFFCLLDSSSSAV
jgi:hypothetical protein